MSSRRCARRSARHDGARPHRAGHRAVRHELRRLQSRRPAERRRGGGHPGAGRSRAASAISTPRPPMATPRSCSAACCPRATACASSPRRRRCRTTSSSGGTACNGSSPSSVRSNGCGSTALYGLLVHQAADLGKPGWQHLVEALHALKSRGMVGRIGVSVYDEQQLDLAESRFRARTRATAAQCARPAADRIRLARAAEGAGHRDSCALGVPARAAADVALRPAGILRADSSGARAPAATNGRSAGLSPLAACLAFVLRQPEIDAAIVGVNRLAEFDEIADAVAAAGGSRRRFRRIARDRAALSRSVALAGAALSAARSADAMRSSSHFAVRGLSLRRIARHRRGARDALPGDCRSDEIGRVAHRVL